MKRCRGAAFFLMIFVSSGVAVLHAQEIANSISCITIAPGSTVQIDGTMTGGEWDDAGSMHIRVSAVYSIEVRFKHDGESLLFAFSGFQPSPTRVPEVLLDVSNEKPFVWTTHQWWFHASGNDCWSQGRYNAWDTCVPESLEWEANNPPWPADAFEMRIPLETLGLVLEEWTTIGISLNVTDTDRKWNMWPSGAQLGIPKSWGEAVIVPMQR
jgi:hypothetical protein